LKIVKIKVAPTNTMATQNHRKTFAKRLRTANLT